MKVNHSSLFKRKEKKRKERKSKKEKKAIIYNSHMKSIFHLYRQTHIEVHFRFYSICIFNLTDIWYVWRKQPILFYIKQETNKKSRRIVLKYRYIYIKPNYYVSYWSKISMDWIDTRLNYSIQCKLGAFEITR